LIIIIYLDAIFKSRFFSLVAGIYILSQDMDGQVFLMRVHPFSDIRHRETALQCLLWPQRSGDRRDSVWKMSAYDDPNPASSLASETWISRRGGGEGRRKSGL